AGIRLYINIKTLQKIYLLTTLKLSVSRRYISLLKSLAPAYKGSSIKPIERIYAYIIPPWYNYILLVYKADRNIVIIAAKDIKHIIIIT
ncbi:hypothetical protein FOC1_g10006155, partial [Fusarium oxysporum f. sp. cubense race 1]